MLKKRSLLRGLTLEISDDGKIAKGLVIFQEGAWDTDENEWVGVPRETRTPVSNIDAEGKKRLNDVLSIVTTTALEDSAIYRDANAKMAVELSQALERAESYVQDANRAHKLADAWSLETAQTRESRDKYKLMYRDAEEDMNKAKKTLRRLTFGLLGR